MPIWVRLPDLPRQYWFKENFTCIGNILRSFLEADMSFKVTKLRRVARILVNINVREGLYEEIHLSWGYTFFKQRLDYENIPFRCRHCHEHGHFSRNCPQNVLDLPPKPPQEKGSDAEGFT